MKSIFEEHGGRYIQCGDYLIPELGLTEQEQKPLGKYGMMRRKYLEENRSGLYTRMILSGTLYEHHYQNVHYVQLSDSYYHNMNPL